MEMKKSKKEVLAICGVIAIIVVMIAGVMLLTKNKVNKEEQSQETKEDDVLAKVNELNKFFSKDLLDSESTKESPGGTICNKYIGQNTSEVIQKAVSLYENLLTMEYGFILDRPDEDSEYDMYVCKPNNCELSEDYAYDVTSSEEDEISFKLKNNEEITYKYKERDNNWRLNQPVFSCKK